MMDKHERIWGWFEVVEENGGWEEYDEPVRRALHDIEQIPGLPEDFEVSYIKEKLGVGIRIEFENEGPCNKAVYDIVRRVEDETFPIMLARREQKDLEAYERVMAEFKKNPVIYSHEEVVRELELDNVELPNYPDECPVKGWGCDGCDYHQECFPD